MVLFISRVNLCEIFKETHRRHRSLSSILPWSTLDPPSIFFPESDHSNRHLNYFSVFSVSCVFAISLLRIFVHTCRNNFPYSTLNFRNQQVVTQNKGKLAADKNFDNNKSEKQIKLWMRFVPSGEQFHLVTFGSDVTKVKADRLILINKWSIEWISEPVLKGAKCGASINVTQH